MKTLILPDIHHKWQRAASIIASEPHDEEACYGKIGMRSGRKTTMLRSSATPPARSPAARVGAGTWIPTSGTTGFWRTTRS